MFSLSVVDTDIFLDMPSTTQNLYFHLGMRADDDGFVGNPKKITRTINSSDDDLKLLIAKGFIEFFEQGIVFVTNWKENNDIRWDRYTPSKYQLLKPEYDFGKKVLPVGSTNGSTQVRLGKDSIEEKRNFLPLKKAKRYYNGEEMRFSQGKWWVMPKNGGDWLLFAGKLDKDTEVR